MEVEPIAPLLVTAPVAVLTRCSLLPVATSGPLLPMYTVLLPSKTGDDMMLVVAAT